MRYSLIKHIHSRKQTHCNHRHACSNIDAFCLNAHFIFGLQTISEVWIEMMSRVSVWIGIELLDNRFLIKLNDHAAHFDSFLSVT